MYKKRIPQARRDVTTFQVQVGRALIKLKVLGGGDPKDRNECLLRYDEWREFDKTHIKNIRTAAGDALRRAARRDAKPLRDVFDDFLLSDHCDLHSSLQALGSAYLVDLIMEVRRKEKTSVLYDFLGFLEKYL